MSITINHQTNDLSATSGSLTIDGAGVGGGLQFISSTDLSSDATADFTGFNSALYDSYEFTLSNVIPTTDGTYLSIRTSSNGGSTYDSGGSSYSYIASWDEVGSDGRLGNNGTNAMVITGKTIGNASGEEGVSGVVQILGPHITKRTGVVASLGFENASGIITRSSAAGFRLSSADVDAVRFFMISGSLLSGTITMYGMVNS